VDFLFIDYIEILINHNKHWSVVIIPHLESLGQDHKMQTSCILHLDSLEGGHRQVDYDIQTRLRKVWIQKAFTSLHDSHEMKSAIQQMRYIVAKV
jgi:Ulp1 family protease